MMRLPTAVQRTTLKAGGTPLEQGHELNSSKESSHGVFHIGRL